MPDQSASAVAVSPRPTSLVPHAANTAFRALPADGRQLCSVWLRVKVAVPLKCVQQSTSQKPDLFRHNCVLWLAPIGLTHASSQLEVQEPQVLCHRLMQPRRPRALPPKLSLLGTPRRPEIPSVNAIPPLLGPPLSSSVPLRFTPSLSTKPTMRLLNATTLKLTEFTRDVPHTRSSPTPGAMRK